MKREREKIIDGWSSISIPTDWKPQIIQICRAKKFASVSEFVREAIREKLKKEAGVKK